MAKLSADRIYRRPCPVDYCSNGAMAFFKKELHRDENGEWVDFFVCVNCHHKDKVAERAKYDTKAYEITLGPKQGRAINFVIARLNAHRFADDHNIEFNYSGHEGVIYMHVSMMPKKWYDNYESMVFKIGSRGSIERTFFGENEAKKKAALGESGIYIYSDQSLAKKMEADAKKKENPA